MLALAAFLVAACETPTLAPPGAAPGDGPAALIGVANHSMALAPDSAVASAADTDTIWFPIDSVNTGDPWPDTIKVGLPAGDTISVRTLGDSGKVKVVVGADTFVYQIGVWENGSASNGDFIGIIWKNGQFAGFWGHCSIKWNDWYFSRDPATGRIYLHWKNTSATTAWTYHYILDPQTNVMKIYHRRPDGSVVLVYRGAPIQKQGNLPPPDPPAGQGPWTSEAQVAAWIAAGSPGGGTSTGTGPSTGGGSSPTPAPAPTPTPTPVSGSFANLANTAH
jgi:hypothetical protein